MSRQSLNLPINIPWRQIAVSPDMMDEEFCNKKFPFAWRSSMAISVYEPKPEDLPEELCGDRITYIKVTTSITGYQPTKDETELLDKLVEFSDFPAEKEDLRGTIERIEKTYFACYGVLLNVAVFPYPNTKKEFLERGRIDFSKVRQQGAPNNSPFLEPGSDLDSPYTHPTTGVIFDPGLESNNLVDLIHLGNGTDAELNLHTKMVIGLSGPAGFAAVEAKVAYLHSAGVKMEAFSANGLVGTATSESAPKQVHTLFIEAEDIQKIVITSPKNEASLLEFAYFVSKEVDLELKDYPHIIDFEPKKRDLYQGATESGEILTSSNSSVSTDKTFTHTESTESGVAFSAKFGPPKVGGGYGGIQGEIEPKEEFTGSYTHKWGATDQDQTSIRRDASRERRETQGTTAQLSQMYNILTGYHAGTNRAAFLMLARPHVLQPTDFRTFAQGLRAIEGIQEHFLIVARPEGIEGLCIEAILETGNYPEDTSIIEPEEEHEESQIDWVVNAKASGAGFWPGQSPECVHIENSPSAVKLAPSGWIVDQSENRKRQPGGDVGSGWDENHPGLADMDQEESSLPSQINYQADDAGALISGKICGSNPLVGSGNAKEFIRKFRLFIRSEHPVKSYQEPHADIGRLLITSRGLCTCFKSGECIEVIPPPIPPEEPPPYIEHIVDEPVIRMNKTLLTRSANSRSRLPAMKEFQQKTQAALMASFRSPKRYAFGEIGILDSDYFKDQVTKILPEDYLKGPIGRVKNLLSEVIRAFGDDFSVNSALEIPLVQFARRTGLSIKKAAKARRQLLGISTSNNDNGEDKDKEQKYQKWKP